ncbi:MAG TPA: hypothetical protein VJ785_00245, partial [Anaerolineales bacterium]|nr:hypothetical protein [Anaerolineales bacterium]
QVIEFAALLRLLDQGFHDLIERHDVQILYVRNSPYQTGCLSAILQAAYLIVFPLPTCYTLPDTY